MTDENNTVNTEEVAAPEADVQAPEADVAAPAEETPAGEAEGDE